MRVTTSMTYATMQNDYNRVNKALYDVNRQISSGQKITYAHEDTQTFANTVRLDNEITTFEQVKKASDSGLKFSTQTDTTLGEISKSLESLKVKMVEAASADNSDASMQAIAKEMQSTRSHLLNLFNTSVNGEYLFSGSATNVRPINEDGSYNGNDRALEALIGNKVKQTYNVTGQQLLYGEESNSQRKITLNLPKLNQTLLHPERMTNSSETPPQERYIQSSDTIRDLVGDDNAVVGDGSAHNFYLRGVQSDGTAFASTVTLQDDDSVQTLLDSIAQAFGNTPNKSVVNVSLNAFGQIEIEDKQKGSSLIDFNMVGNSGAAVANVDTLLSNSDALISFSQQPQTALSSTVGAQRDRFYVDENAPTQELNILKMTLLKKDGEVATSSTVLSDIFRSDAATIDVNGASVATTLTVQDLVNTIAADANVISASFSDGKISYIDDSTSSASIVLTSLDAGAVAVNALSSDASVVYDKARFTKEGAKLQATVAQIVKSDNSFATAATKLVDGAQTSSLDGEAIHLEGLDINGTAFSVDVELSNTVPPGVVVRDSATATALFTVYNSGVDPKQPISTVNPQSETQADEMSYQQLLDVVNMVVTNQIPAAPAFVGGVETSYQSAKSAAEALGSTQVDMFGKISFTQLNSTSTQASLSMFDANNASSASNASVMQFSSNSALEIADPKQALFEQIDAMIEAVQNGTVRSNGEDLASAHNVGIQNGIAKMDAIIEHVSRKQAEVGVQSLSLQNSADRTDLLIVSTKTLRSEVIDTDLAEASLRLQQLSLNFQAQLNTISRVNQLSLVNYI